MHLLKLIGSNWRFLVFRSLDRTPRKRETQKFGNPNVSCILVARLNEQHVGSPQKIFQEEALIADCLKPDTDTRMIPDGCIVHCSCSLSVTQHSGKKVQACTALDAWLLGWLLKARQRKPASPEFKKIAQRFGNREVRVSRSSSLHEDANGCTWIEKLDGRTLHCTGFFKTNP